MKNIILTFFAAVLLITVSSCRKKPETPPVTSYAAGNVYPVEYLKVIATCSNSCQRKFGNGDYLIGTVLADEVSGNFYKEVYLRDKTGRGAIRLDFLFTKSGFFVGDSLRIHLNGYDVAVDELTGMLQIDSIDFVKSVVKFGHGPAPMPRQITLSEISASNPYSNYLCDLITINGAGFVAADAGKPYADVITQSSLNRAIQDCSGNQVLVRTSNYADFASAKTPTGFGSITGIATAYQGTNQMAIRRTSEVMMNNAPCAVYLKKDFNDNSLTSGGWTQQSVTNPTVQWTASSFGTDLFGRISGYVSGNTNSENWLISPVIDLSTSANPVLDFRTAAKFSGNALELWVSSDYVSGAPSTGTWTQLTGWTISPNTGNYVWTGSGLISLNAFKMNGVRIAFKYKSTTSGATTYEVDDINIRENI